MAVKLRLMRMGKAKQPTYRLVAADSRSPRDGRFIEVVGTYAPREEHKKVVLKPERVSRWLKEGAQPTDRVRRILVSEGLVEAAPAPSSARQAEEARAEEARAEAARAEAARSEEARSEEARSEVPGRSEVRDVQAAAGRSGGQGAGDSAQGQVE